MQNFSLWGKSNFLFIIKGIESGSAENLLFFPRSGVKEQVSGLQIRKEVRRGRSTPPASWLGAGKRLLFRISAGQAGENLLRTDDKAELGAGAPANLGMWRPLVVGAVDS